MNSLRHLAAATPVACTCDSMNPGTTVRPAGIDDSRLGTGQLADGGGRADGGKGVPANRDRFGLRIPWRRT
jgi:hypothetical protein